MNAPAARLRDQVTGTDTHIVMVPSGSGTAPSPLPHPFTALITGGVSSNVLIEDQPAATAGSETRNVPPHVPTPPGVSFQVPPTNQGTVQDGSSTVLINDRPAARLGDRVLCCNDPVPQATGTIFSGARGVQIG